MKYITVDEFKSIIEEIKTNYTKREEAIVGLMFENGLFIKEVLKAKDTDLVKYFVEGKEYYVLQVKHTMRDRGELFTGTYNVDISEPLYKFIEKYIAEKDNTQNVNNYLFLGDNGKPLTIARWNKTLRDIFNACNIEFEENEDLNIRFRHGFAMYFLEKYDLTATQFKDLLRFVSVQSVKIYPITHKMQSEFDALDLFAKKFFSHSIKA